MTKLIEPEVFLEKYFDSISMAVPTCIMKWCETTLY